MVDVSHDKKNDEKLHYLSLCEDNTILTQHLFTIELIKEQANVKNDENVMHGNVEKKCREISVIMSNFPIW